MTTSKTLVETQEMLGCKRRKIFKLLKDGVLERAEPLHSGNVGRLHTRVTTESILNYIKSKGGEHDAELGNGKKE